MSEKTTPSNTAPYKNTQTWMRGLFMLLFVFFYHLAVTLLGAVAIIQFAWVLATGRHNPQLTEFGAGLSRFFYQLVRFLTFNSDTKPFPFSDWPRDPLPNDPIAGQTPTP